MSNKNILCPECGHFDMVRKVSAIAEDTAIASGEYGPVSLRSDLARELAPPDKPKSFSAAPCIIIVPLLILILFTSFGMPGTTSPSFMILLLAIIGTLVFGFLLSQRQAQDKVPNWQEALNKWNQLYCCTRERILFNPDDFASGTLPAVRKNMLDYLYDQDRKSTRLNS